MKFIGVKALYPKVKTTIANQEHKKYKYLLNEFKNNNNQVIIDTPNKVWSTDITYITTTVLREALYKYPKPDIVNTEEKEIVSL